VKFKWARTHLQSMHLLLLYIDTSATLGRMHFLPVSLSTETSVVLDKSTTTQKERATADMA